MLPGTARVPHHKAATTLTDDIEQRVTDYLDGLGAQYEIVRIDPAFADTAEFCAQYDYPIETSGNTIIVASKRGPAKFCAAVVRADKRLDVNKKICQLMGVKRASFAKPEQTVELTGMMIGGVTCLALPDSIPIYVDPSLLEQPYVILGGGSRSCKIKADPAVLKMLTNAEVVEGLTL